MLGRFTPSQFACKVKDGLLKVVVAFGRNYILLNLPILHINLVTADNHGNVLTHHARVSIHTSELQSTITCNKHDLFRSKPAHVHVPLFLLLNRCRRS